MIVELRAPTIVIKTRTTIETMIVTTDNNEKSSPLIALLNLARSRRIARALLMLMAPPLA
jgi:hypothetical protein